MNSVRAGLRRPAPLGRQARRHASAAAGSSRSAWASSPRLARLRTLEFRAGTLIGMRAAQGIGAAMMNPASLSIIAAAFAPRERGTRHRPLGRRLRPWRSRSARSSAASSPSTPAGTGSSSSTPDRRHRHRRRIRLHRRVARHLPRAAPRPARASLTLGARPLRAHVRPHRGEPATAGPDPRSSPPSSSPPSSLDGVRPARAAPADPDDGPSRSSRTAPSPAREPRDAARRPRDVRRLLLRLALHAERPPLLAGQGRRRVPADDARSSSSSRRRQGISRTRSARAGS